MSQFSWAIERFIERLESLAVNDRGAMAVLRRNAGRILAESRQALPLFYGRLLPALKDDHQQRTFSQYEEIIFLVATLRAIHKHGESPQGNFGVTMRAVKAADGSSPDAIDRRFSVLLDSHFERLDQGRLGGGELAFRLRQAVQLADSKRVGVNWAKLIEDLISWEAPDGRVRKEWARAYYGETPQAGQSKGE